MEDIVALAKRRGFVFPTSEIYGGLANSYDYGPYGAQMLKNIRDVWWKYFIQKRPDMVGIDTQIIQHPQTWVASGHVSSFNEAVVEDLKTHKRYRADHLIETWAKIHDPALVVEDLHFDQWNTYLKENSILSPEGNPIGDIKKLNQLFETGIGTVAGEKSQVYLRGETAQGIFANFKQIIDSSRVKLPFGVGNIGKSFRNEITQGQFVFRTLEFEQAEIEYFFDPVAQAWQDVLAQWKDAMWDFVVRELGIRTENLRWRRHTDIERSHYSTDTYDLDYKFPFGFKELWGVAYRSDYDLKQHAKYSGVDLQWTDSRTGRVFVPHVVEPAVGVNRLFVMCLADAYMVETTSTGKTRTVLKLHTAIAPVKIAIFPLQKDPILRTVARRIYDTLVDRYMCEFDDAGNIGKMYRRQDEIGTPFCITVDYDTIQHGTVTVRDRDSMAQERVHESELLSFFTQKL